MAKKISRTGPVCLRELLVEPEQPTNLIHHPIRSPRRNALLRVQLACYVWSPPISSLFFFLSFRSCSRRLVALLRCFSRSSSAVPSGLVPLASPVTSIILPTSSEGKGQAISVACVSLPEIEKPKAKSSEKALRNGYRTRTQRGGIGPSFYVVVVSSVPETRRFMTRFTRNFS